MDWKVLRVNQEIKKHDPTLFAYRTAKGAILILRKADRLAASDYNQTLPELSSLNPQLVLALTDTWRPDGNPVDMGLELILDQLKSMDMWNQWNILERVSKNRETEEDNRKRSFKNNVGALAADMRHDFAKATNDVIIRR